VARAVERGASGGQLAARQAYIVRCEQDVNAAAAALALQQAVVGKAREALATAAQEREALERLKERGRAEHEPEARRAEDDALGEVALAAHRRKVA
jgi:flagellar protein FliJ